MNSRLENFWSAKRQKVKQSTEKAKLKQEFDYKESWRINATESCEDNLLVESDYAFALKLQEQENLKANKHPIQQLQNPPIRQSDDKAISLITLEVDPIKFNPSDYSAILSKDKFEASYFLLVYCFCRVNSTRSRIIIINCLTNLLRLLITFDESSLLPAIFLSSNSIFPEYEGAELNIGPSTFSKALKNVSGLSSAELKLLWNKYGDPGDVAFKAKTNLNTLKVKDRLSIKGVYNELLKISRLKGPNTNLEKQRIVEHLLLSAQGEELRYLSRTLLQNLRIGSVGTTMLIAISKAFLFEKGSNDFKNANLTFSQYKEAEEMVKGAFSRRPNYNDLISVLMKHSISELHVLLPIKVGIPIKPMLGTITRDLNQVLCKLQGRSFAVEFKYDGQRAQIHYLNGETSIFSRHLENITGKYPDITNIIPEIRTETVYSFILEGEIVAIDRENGLIKSFQDLSSRNRKNVHISSLKANVCVFAFDLMYLNHQNLLERSFRERRNLLRSLFIPKSRVFQFVESIDATDKEQDLIETFFKLSIQSKCEGLMAKPLDNPTNTSSRGKPFLSTYLPEKRSENWLKVKKDYDACSDSLDLVPIGAWYGQGRKAGWYSPILLAVRNNLTGDFDAVCKCISGFTDSFYIDLKKRYAQDSGNILLNVSYTSPLRPDVWFQAREVWEIKGADITMSPIYKAAIGLVSESRGLSIRFPRFIRIREDKSVEDASTDLELADMYKKQFGR